MTVAVPGGVVRPRAGSIVVPAWNEETVIERTLGSLLDGLDRAGPGEHVRPPVVVVAANGCTDRTVEIARALAARVPDGVEYRVLDLPAIGKAGAIRAAESVLDELPRIYLDADTTMSGPAAIAVLSELRSGRAHGARPPIRYAIDDASRLVRAFYRIRAELPGVAGDLCGAGVYGLSDVARGRFGEFPEVSGDDLFAARVVADDEVSIVDADPVEVHVPRNARALVKTLARIYRGNRQVSEVDDQVAGSTARRTVRDLRGAASTPRRAADATVYAVVVVLGRLASMRPATGWERDDTARSGEQETP